MIDVRNKVHHGKTKEINDKEKRNNTKHIKNITQ